MSVVMEDRANQVMSVIRDGKISKVIWLIGMFGFTVASILFVVCMPLVVIGAVMGLGHSSYENIYHSFMLWSTVSAGIAVATGTLGVISTEEGD